MKLLSGSIVMRHRPPVNVSSWVTVRSFGGTPWTVLFGLVTRALQPYQLLCGFADGLLGGPLFGGHGTRDCFDELMLYMEQVG